MGAGYSLGQRIREVRLQKKLTQTDVVGDYMTRNMLSKIENGSAAPSVRTLEFLAVALDVPVSYFLDGSDREPVNTEQLREIDDLACMVLDCEGKNLPALSLCIRARTRLAAGRPDAALSMMEGVDPVNYPEEVHNDIYAVLEDCYRLKGNYRLAYEYALKRLGEHA
ncbi:MAG: helix-turn-helix domain-containing protein [Defluviitaleaceae bacterium]|nr:helix-turn-helix domain-containing protein [Defluviitaleaceae bacterium]MCL2836200.1 helix-turn-helix domain-containing protein [Defluviitaleaceae bacterium]